MITGIRTHIFIGDREILRAPHVWIESERRKPLTWAGVTLPDAMGEQYRSIRDGDPVEIRLGYRDEEPTSWKGMVVWKRTGTDDQVEVGAVCEALPLTDARITQSWENETPEAIIKWVIRQAGLSVGRVDSPGVVLPKFMASHIPPWQVARQCAFTCREAFGLDMSKWALWMNADGKINWGDFDEPGDTPMIATGAGLIKHIPEGAVTGWSKVETFLLAGFRHSQKFGLVDTRRGVDGEYRALKVRHEVKERSVRTFIWFGEEHG